MGISNNFFKSETLMDQKEIILIYGMKTHDQIHVCQINTHELMQSTIVPYDKTITNVQKIIGKLYSRQQRNGAQIIIHGFDEMVALVEDNGGLALSEDIKLTYVDLMDFYYKEVHYVLEDVELLRQNVFKYFDLYNKLNAMCCVRVYCVLEYIISIIDQNYINLNQISKNTEEGNAHLKEAIEKEVIVESAYKPMKRLEIAIGDEGESLQLNEKQLIVLLECENSLTEMVKDYTIKFMRLHNGTLEDIRSLTTYGKNKNWTNKEKCIFFVKEFYPSCTYIQGKFDLEEIIVIGMDVREFMKIIYNTAGFEGLLDMRQFTFEDLTESKWRTTWEMLIGESITEDIELEMIKEKLAISDAKIGVDVNKYKSLYAISLDTLLLRLLVIYNYDQDAYVKYLRALR